MQYWPEEYGGAVDSDFYCESGLNNGIDGFRVSTEFRYIPLYKIINNNIIKKSEKIEVCQSVTSEVCFETEDMYMPGESCSEYLTENLVSQDLMSEEDVTNACMLNPDLLYNAIDLLEEEQIATKQELISNNVIKLGVNITSYDDICGTKVVIPNKIDEKDVFGIGEGAFSEKNIEKVKIPDSIYVIEEFAFGMNQISGELDLSNAVNLIAIGMQAFAINNISSIKFPKNIQTIGEMAFSINYIEKIELENIPTLQNCSLGLIDKNVYQGLPDDYVCEMPSMG